MATPLNERDLIELNAYLDGELSAAERAAFEQRLEASPALRAELVSFRQTKALLGMAEPVPLPRNFTLDPAVYGAPEPRTLWERLGLPPVAVFAPAAAALVAALVCVGVLLINRGGGPLQVAMEEPAAEEPAMMQAPADEAVEEEEVAEEEADEMASPPAEEEAAGEEADAFAAEEAEPAEEPQEEMLAEEPMAEEESAAEDAVPAEADTAAEAEEEGEAAPAPEEPMAEEAAEAAATPLPTLAPGTGVGGGIETPSPSPTATPGATAANIVEPTAVPEEAERVTDGDVGEEVAEAETPAAAQAAQPTAIFTATPGPTSALPARTRTILIAVIAVLILAIVGIGASLLLGRRRR